jgi:hypothetical protein
MRIPRVLVAMALVPLAAPSLASAQSQGAARATARVLQSIIVTGLRDLDFGSIAPTQAKTVTAQQGGRFRIRGQRNTPALIQFTQLPSSLGPGLTLSDWTGWQNNRNNNNGASAFTPVAGGSLSATLSNNGRYFIRLGATLTATGASPGSYSVPVVITVMYD